MKGVANGSSKFKCSKIMLKVLAKLMLVWSCSLIFTSVKVFFGKVLAALLARLTFFNYRARILEKRFAGMLARPFYTLYREIGLFAWRKWNHFRFMFFCFGPWACIWLTFVNNEWSLVFPQSKWNSRALKQTSKPPPTRKIRVICLLFRLGFKRSLTFRWWNVRPCLGRTIWK